MESKIFPIIFIFVEKMGCTKIKFVAFLKIAQSIWRNLLRKQSVLFTGAEPIPNHSWLIFQLFLSHFILWLADVLYEICASWFNFGEEINELFSIFSYLNLMQPVPGPGAVQRTWISVLGTDDVCVIPFEQTSLNRLSESLKSRKLPAVSGDVGMEGLDGVAVKRKPINFWRTFCDRQPCKVTGTRKLRTSHRFHIKRPWDYGVKDEHAICRNNVKSPSQNTQSAGINDPSA